MCVYIYILDVTVFDLIVGFLFLFDVRLKGKNSLSSRRQFWLVQDFERF